MTRQVSPTSIQANFGYFQVLVSHLESYSISSLKAKISWNANVFCLSLSSLFSITSGILDNILVSQWTAQQPAILFVDKWITVIKSSIKVSPTLQLSLNHIFLMFKTFSVGVVLEVGTDTELALFMLQCIISAKADKPI